MVAMRYGLARGIYANEAGYGTAAVAYGTARSERPVEQGLNAVIEVYIVSFVTDGIHWGTRDYRYLRNGMALASFSGALLLFASEAYGHASLALDPGDRLVVETPGGGGFGEPE